MSEGDGCLGKAVSGALVPSFNVLVSLLLSLAHFFLVCSYFFRIFFLSHRSGDRKVRKINQIHEAASKVFWSIKALCQVCVELSNSMIPQEQRNGDDPLESFSQFPALSQMSRMSSLSSLPRVKSSERTLFHARKNQRSRVLSYNGQLGLFLKGTLHL